MHLFISDLDGTLFTPDSCVSPRTCELLSALPPEKAFTIATARTPATVDLILPSEMLADVPAIVISGSALWHRGRRCYSDVCLLDPALARLGEEAILAEGLAPFTYTIDASGGMLYAYTRIPADRPPFGRLTEAERAFVDERRNLPLKHIYDTPDPGQWPPLLVFGIGSYSACRRAARRVTDRAPEAYVSIYGDIFSPDRAYIEVFAPGVNKGAAALRLKEQLRATHLTTFGDSANDAPLLAVADTSVAVANANSVLRENAQIIIGPNTEDSVARFIAYI